MKSFLDAFLTMIIICSLVELVFNQEKDSDDGAHVGRALTSIYSPLDFIGGKTNRRLASIPKRIGLSPSDHIMADEVVVAVLDTGIDLNNKWIMDRVYRVNGAPQIYDLSGSTKDGSDQNGHGTLITSIILSINPSAKVVIIKCMDSSSDNEDGYVMGLRFAHMTPGVSIINISGGGEGYSEEEKEEIEMAQNKDILVVAASGNKGKDLSQDSFYPASLREQGVLSVANLKDDGSLGDNSSFGSYTVDLGALGTDVPGYDHRGYMTFQTGTSQATAVVSGIASLVKGFRPEFKAKELKETLIKTASPSRFLKHGKVNPARALEVAHRKISLSRNLNNEEDALGNNLLIEYRR